MKLTLADRAIVLDHIEKLEQLAQTHRGYAAMPAVQAGCAQTAEAAARKAERLAAILRDALTEREPATA